MYIYICVYICVCIYIYVYICIYICVYIYTYADTKPAVRHKAVAEVSRIGHHRRGELL